MKQLTFFSPSEYIESPPAFKTPDDVYRAELRLTWHPDTGRRVVAIELTHEHTRELIYWKLFAHDGTVDISEYYRRASVELERLVQELDAPF